jgi:hypothetical protein
MPVALAQLQLITSGSVDVPDADTRAVSVGTYTVASQQDNMYRHHVDNDFALIIIWSESDRLGHLALII